MLLCSHAYTIPQNSAYYVKAARFTAMAQFS